MAHQHQGYVFYPQNHANPLTDIGEANIRKMLYSGDPSQTSITCGTYGIIYRVSKEDDERLHAFYGIDRVRIGQCVHAKHPSQPTGIVGLPVVIYWDPRNTRDGWNYHKWNSGDGEKNKWTKALRRLKGEGVPTFWLIHVAAIVQGVKENYSKVIDDARDNSFEIKPHDNTIYVNPQDLSYTPPTTDEPPAPLRIHVNRGRPQGPTARGRTEQTLPRSQTPRSQPASKPQVQAMTDRAEQAVARQAIPSKPQSASTSQSASRPQGQVTIGRAEQVMFRQPTPSNPQSTTSPQSTFIPQGQVMIGRAEQAMSKQSTPSKPQSTTPPQPAPKPQGQSAKGRAEQVIPRLPNHPKSQSTTPPPKPPKPQGPTISRAEQITPRAPTLSKPQSAVKPQGQQPAIGRAEHAISRETPPAKPQSDPQRQSTTSPQSVPRPRWAISPQSANPKPGTKAQPAMRLSTSIPNGLGLNLKVGKKRKPDSNDDGGQPMKKQISKKQPPAPSNLRHGTPA
jgi:hypothetical protein